MVTCWFVGVASVQQVWVRMVVGTDGEGELGPLPVLDGRVLHATANHEATPVH